MATPIGLPKFLPCKTPKFSVTSSILSNGRERNKTPTFPISITTNPSAINLDHLSHLYAACNHSCHRFPAVDASTGRVEPVGVAQLAVAIAHSAVVVAVFALIGDDGEEEGVLQRIFRPAAKRAAPENGRLVGFGRAVSDMGLTASLYDVMVLPSLQGMGIGRMIVQKIIRILTNRGIYDIAAVCTENERVFFEGCGFGDDILGSTTMMYLRSPSIDLDTGHQIVTQAGRRLLVAPPPRTPFAS